MKKAEKDDFNQPTVCEPPVSWFKYTTFNAAQILIFHVKHRAACTHH